MREHYGYLWLHFQAELLSISMEKRRNNYIERGIGYYMNVENRQGRRGMNSYNIIGLILMAFGGIGLLWVFGLLWFNGNLIFHQILLIFKHVLGGISLLSLLAAFEVFSIPAANGIINIFGLTKLFAGLVWIATAVLSGGLAIILDAEERNK